MRTRSGLAVNTTSPPTPGGSITPPTPGGLSPCRVPVLAERLAVHFRDLADRAERLHGGDERRHQVLTTLGRFAHATERGPRGGPVALPLHAADAVGLSRLDLERDAEQLGRPLLG